MAALDRIHLPDASGDRARCAGQLSDLRDGAGAAYRHARRRKEPRTRRHGAAILVKRRSVAAVAADRDERDTAGESHRARRSHAVDHLDSVRVGYARGALGWTT